MGSSTSIYSVQRIVLSTIPHTAPHPLLLLHYSTYRRAAPGLPVYFLSPVSLKVTRADRQIRNAALLLPKVWLTAAHPRVQPQSELPDEQALSSTASLVVGPSRTSPFGPLDDLLPGHL